MRIEALNTRGLAVVVPVLILALLGQVLSWLLGLTAEVTHRLACAAAAGAQGAATAEWAQQRTAERPRPPHLVMRDLFEREMETVA